MAPKKWLKKRKPICASFKVTSLTIFPSKKPPFKVKKNPIVPDREDLAPINFHTTDNAKDDEIARNLQPITQHKVDKYGNPWYRAWAPQDMGGGCPSEDHLVVLVQHRVRSEETEETKQPSEYMTFQQLKQHSLIKLNELPLEVKSGANLMFLEDAQLHADRMKAQEGGQLTKPIQKKWLFCTVWRRTHADLAGYEKFVEDLPAFHKKRQ
jgi:hypothetical protein